MENLTRCVTLRAPTEGVVRRARIILYIAGKDGKPGNAHSGGKRGGGYSTWYWPATWLTWAETSWRVCAASWVDSSRSMAWSMLRDRSAMALKI